VIESGGRDLVTLAIKWVFLQMVSNGELNSGSLSFRWSGLGTTTNRFGTQSAARFRSAGYRCSVFPSANAFLESDTLDATDSMVLDVRMPEVTGPELQTRLRAMNGTVPVIFVTGHADDEMRARALRKGATAFLKKPFCEDALLDAIRSALNGTVS